MVERSRNANTERVLNKAIYQTLLKSVHNKLATGENFQLNSLDSDINKIADVMLDGGHISRNDMDRAKDALRIAFLD